MKVIIILPTYNERENIDRLIPILFEKAKSLTDEIHLLVVDDNSPDGTQDRVREQQKIFPRLHMITGKKEGLGAAYLRGMKEAMEMGADAVFEMDSDFSHDPDDVPRLLATLHEGADFVIGSRYVPGGSIPSSWNLYRKLNSMFGNFVARYIAGISKVRDCTAGFRCIRTDLLRRLDLSTIRTQGYGFQVSLLHSAYINSAVIREIPVHFTDRTIGVSKLGLSDVIEFIMNAWTIRLRTSETFLKFCAVGLSGVIVNLGMFSILQHMGVGKYVASLIAIETSVLGNFLLNYRWTFNNRDKKRSAAVKGLQFNVVSFISLGISFSTFSVLTSIFPHYNPALFQLAGIIPATLVNYFLNSYWTFVNRK